jgi:hypothetical protein
MAEAAPASPHEGSPTEDRVRAVLGKRLPLYAVHLVGNERTKDHLILRELQPVR